MDLSEFLLARIAEDEAVAGGADRFVWDDPSDAPWVAAAYTAELSKASAHIARFTPARVLTECEAKRAIVEEHREWSSVGVSDTASTWGEGAEGSAALDTVLRFLALPYADHPDYQPEWSPTALAG